MMTASDPGRPPDDGTGLDDGVAFDDSVTRRVDALFGEGTATEVAGRRRRRRTRKVVVAGVVVSALLASAVWASFASGDAAGNYRTATAGIHDVAQQLTGVATIEPVSQAAVAFPVSGTVATVDVAIGDTVAVGQQLATLDTGSLTDTLHEKEAALAQAELNLSKALAGESTSGATSGGSSAGSGGSPTSMGSAVTAASSVASTSDAILAAVTVPSGTSGSSDELTAARQAVVDAQAAVDDALAAAQAAMASATSVCAAVTGGSGSTTTSTTSTPSSSDDLSACRTAIEAVQDAQQQVSDAQTTLATASSALDQMLATMTDSAGSGSTASGSAGAATGGQSTAPTGASSGSVGGSSAGGGSTATDTVSSEDLIAAQRAVDAAALDVAVAQQAVDQATIVSPIAGTVVAVGIDVGDAVESASDTQHVIVQGTDGYEVVTTVGVDDVAQVRVGQSAVVVPDGATSADGSTVELDGTVVGISTTPEADSSTTSFRVTIGLTERAVDLGNGSTGTVTITTDGATSVLAVPTSAVSTDGDRSTVTTFDGSSTEEVTVQVGAVGERWTQITSGIEEGRTVVLADLDAALPTEASSTDAAGSTGDAGGGQFPGGGQMPTGGPPAGMTRPGG